MTDTEKYEEALRYATEMHKGQYRKGGAEYITHPVAVAEIVREKGGDTDCIITALFHDLLEDTSADEREIERIGGKKVLNAVKLLTKTPGYVMKDYVDGIKSDPTAYLVKGADRLHNLRSACEGNKAFRRRYIAESEEWYMDFLPEIPQAVEALRKTLPEYGETR